MVAFTTAERIDIGVAIASGLVAIATLILAITTGVMARRTRAMAEETKRVAVASEAEAAVVAEQTTATKEQVRISAQALRATIRPWLAKSDSGREVQAIADNADTINVNIWVQNVGPAIALIPPDGCTIRGGGIPPQPSVVRTGYADKPVLRPGAETVILFRVRGEDINADNFWNRTNANGEFLVSIEYTDANGGQPVRADFRIACRDQAANLWVFDQVDYVGVGGEGELDLASVKFLTNP